VRGWAVRWWYIESVTYLDVSSLSMSAALGGFVEKEDESVVLCSTRY
jgi:hypothetical protein